jgi:GTP-binding protein
LEGGKGGKGNAAFCTPIRKSPSFSQQGEKTEAKKIVLELKIIADVGIIGFPNAGKSTFLSVISRAKPKIADYPFTTLSPNLGIVTHKGESFAAADIPGLIEGAALGQGLGHKFLRHIERTRMLIHIIDISGSEGRDPLQDYKTINKELSAYSKTLSKLPQIVAANKMDLPGAKENFDKFKAARKNIKLFPCSAITKSGISEILDECIQMLKTLPPLKPVEYTPFTYWQESDDLFEIVKISKGVFEVKGGLVQTLIRNITLDDWDSFNYFQRQLKQRGVIAKLKEAGAVTNDTVIIGDIEFDFID